MTGALAVSDAELVEQARDGDACAFAELYLRHRARVAGVCRRRVPADDVDDVVQEAFVRAWQGLCGLADGDAFGAWTRTIAVRACADHTRGSAVLARVAEVAPDVADDVVEEQVRRDRAARVVAQLEQLRPRDGRALWLRDAMGVPVSDVAADLGVTEGSASVLLVRARRRLRAVVGGMAAWVAALVGGARRAGPVGVPLPVAAAVAGAVLVIGAGLPDATTVVPAPASPSPTVAPVSTTSPSTPDPTAPSSAPTRGDTGRATPIADRVVPGPSADADAGPDVDGLVPRPDPSLERRPHDDGAAGRAVTLRSPDGDVEVSLHDGGRGEDLPLPPLLRHGLGPVDVGVVEVDL